MLSGMTTEILLVTGASGHLGRRVLDLLLERSPAPKLIATTRTPESLAAYAARGVDVRRADFEDPATLVPAFAGATRALLISTDAVDRPGRRLEQHRRAIAALVAAKVGHVVYTSLPNPFGSPALVAADHERTEAALIDSPLAFTVLRNALYTDYLLQPLAGAVASGKLIDSKGAAAIAYVTRDDCARAAAGALASSHGGRTTIDVTGPAAIDGPQLAAITAEVTGKPIAYLSVPSAAYIDGMVSHGVPRPVADLLASFDRAALRGDYQALSPAVRDFGGAAPISVRDFLRSQLAALG